MKRACGISQLALVSIAVIALSLTFGVAGAWAESPTWLCVPKTAGKAVTSGGTSEKANCEKETTTVELPPASELPTLVKILPHLKYEASGIDSQPTIRISGVNVQIVNGEGKTNTTNGRGNLVIGYNETPGTQTGSHNLILGGEQTFTSYGGILAGFKNTISGPYASVSGGYVNTASGEWASVTGGYGNTASGERSSVTGGSESIASKGNASVSGGAKNTASGSSASVTGGINNTANSIGASVSGGSENKAEDFYASITGGRENKVTTNEWASVSGGRKNTASGRYSSIFGGKELTASVEYEHLP